MVEKEIPIPELNNETIESMIYVIRGQKVMLDFELAIIYGYETRRFNEQVKNNINKFPERYRFQLNKEELNIILRSKKSTAQIWATNKGRRTSLPYSFTEQVKNNINKFSERYRFQLNKEEYEKILRSKKSTSRWGRY